MTESTGRAHGRAGFQRLSWGHELCNILYITRFIEHDMQFRCLSLSMQQPPY